MQDFHLDTFQGGRRGRGGVGGGWRGEDFRDVNGVLAPARRGWGEAEEERTVCLECLQMWKVDRTVYSSSENSSLSSYPYSSSDSSSSTRLP